MKDRGVEPMFALHLKKTGGMDTDQFSILFIKLTKHVT